MKPIKKKDVYEHDESKIPRILTWPLTGPEGSLLCSEQPANGPYRDPEEFSPHSRLFRFRGNSEQWLILSVWLDTTWGMRSSQELRMHRTTQRREMHM
jgi:hypothetical protein